MPLVLKTQNAQHGSSVVVIELAHGEYRSMLLTHVECYIRAGTATIG